jgi:predicted  nucleic acid-binding Zn-ribbon protein
MPHQCTTCGHVFADGSKEMLSGCPDCGGTKFQFHPDGAEIPDSPPGDAEPPERPEPDDSVAGAVGSAAATVRNFVGNSSNTESAGSGSTGTDAPDSLADSTPAPDAGTPTESESETVAGVALNDRSEPAETAPTPAGEDAAQASARSDIVSPDELPETESAAPPVEDGTVVKEPDDEADRPDLSELREELNDQFESIKVLEPGQYELNLMELYDREEYIIALQEDGKYSIQVPDRWQE